MDIAWSTLISELATTKSSILFSIILLVLGSRLGFFNWSDKFIILAALASKLEFKFLVLKGASIWLPIDGALNSTPLINTPPTYISSKPSKRFTSFFPRIYFSAKFSENPANISPKPSSLTS